jgi:mycothiol synthase
MPRSDDTVPAATPEIAVSGPVGAAEGAAVLRLADAAARADGVDPLSEHVTLHLRYGGDAGTRNLLLTERGELAGYAHLDPVPDGARAPGTPQAAEGPGAAEGPSAELFIDPGPLRVWAHGDLPAAAGLAAAAGLQRVRALWQMRRPLSAPLDRPVLAEGITVRTFVTGRDEDEWLRVNSRAFASHPEQGSWTRDDLELREREPWFDPDGFFLAERDGKLAGFHWTKVHPEEPAGEVYVVGVDPGQRGTGLGRALTLIGLDYLRARGLPEVMLYVDASNRPAIRLYESLGFTRWRTDVMYARADQLGQTAARAGLTPRT